MKPILLFVSGMVVGALITGVLLSRTNDKEFGRQYVISALDQATLAVQLQSGKQNAILKRITPRLPEYAANIDKLYKDDPMSKQVLWNIKTFYERGNSPIPAEIAPILKALPPKPPTSCEIRDEKAADVKKK